MALFESTGQKGDFIYYICLNGANNIMHGVFSSRSEFNHLNLLGLLGPVGKQKVKKLAVTKLFSFAGDRRIYG